LPFNESLNHFYKIVIATIWLKIAAQIWNDNGSA